MSDNIDKMMNRCVNELLGQNQYNVCVTLTFVVGNYVIGVLDGTIRENEDLKRNMNAVFQRIPALRTLSKEIINEVRNRGIQRDTDNTVGGEDSSGGTEGPVPDWQTGTDQ